MEPITSFMLEKAVEQTGIWGVKQMLKIWKTPIRGKIQSQMMIDIPKTGHFVRNADPEKNIAFVVIFTRPYPARLTIKRIDYQIAYQGKIWQEKRWEGAVVLDARNIRTRIELLYYPTQSRLGIPSSPKGWRVTGVASIESMYGTFEKSFEGNSLVVDSGDVSWDTLSKSNL
jgi:hypothetical protein